MVLLYIFIAVVLLNCCYFYLFSKFSFFRPSDVGQSKIVPVSLMVCAKNEAANLEKNIPLWLNQDYEEFELILINDSSTDETLDIMESFAEKDPRIQVVNVRKNEAFFESKKYALTLGIKRAKYEKLIFTDADCYPASTNWLKNMATKISDEKEVVLGYGAYEKLPGMLNKIIRYETLMTAVQYFSYARAGMPYMGVGRNLAYTNSIYTKNNGFTSHIKVASGDDDLFINEVATATNTAICVDENTFTYSIPKKNTKNWISQKKRHYTTAKLYKSKHKLLLGVYHFTNMLFWILSVVILFTDFWKIGIALITFRFLIQYIIIGTAAKNLKEQDLVLLIPFYDFFLLLVQISIFIFHSGKTNSQWK